MVSILTRLPVKSLARFKSVSWSWRDLISSPQFIKLHRDQLTNDDPRNLSFVLHRRESAEHTLEHNLSLIYFNAAEKSSPFHFIRFPKILNFLMLVGSIHGLVCLSCRKSRRIVLGNPLLNRWKLIRPSRRNFGGKPDFISVGFGYDPVDDDYKVIRIANFEKTSEAKAEVYSTNLDAWKEVKINFSFTIGDNFNDLILNGIPYWCGDIYVTEDEMLDGDEGSSDLIWFDVHNEVFKSIPWPTTVGDHGKFVEWKAALAMLVPSHREELEDYVDVLVYDEKEASWKKKCRYGSMGLKHHYYMINCSRDGVIFALTEEGKLIIHDPVADEFKKFSFSNGDISLENVCDYKESLVCLEGMVPVQEHFAFGYSFMEWLDFL